MLKRPQSSWHRTDHWVEADVKPYGQHGGRPRDSLLADIQKQSYILGYKNRIVKLLPNTQQVAVAAQGWKVLRLKWVLLVEFRPSTLLLNTPYQCLAAGQSYCCKHDQVRNSSERVVFWGQHEKKTIVFL